jgi:methyl-accepting chemotaxis protein
MGAFENIEGAVQMIRDMTTQIATATEEQHLVTEEINRNVVAINERSVRCRARQPKSSVTHMSSANSAAHSSSWSGTSAPSSVQTAPVKAPSKGLG